VAWHAVNTSGFQPGQTCFIAGAGPIGLFTAKVLKARGAKTIIVSEPAQCRRERCVKHGADYAIDPSVNGAEIEVMRITGDVGVDVAFDCAGVSATVNSCIMATRSTGTVCVISLWEKPASIEMNLVVIGERRIIGSCCNNKCFPDVIEAMSQGKLEGMEDVITRKIPMSELVPEGFEALVNDRENQIKILVTPERVAS